MWESTASHAEIARAILCPSGSGRVAPSALSLRPDDAPRHRHRRRFAHPRPPPSPQTWANYVQGLGIDKARRADLTSAAPRWRRGLARRAERPGRWSGIGAGRHCSGTIPP